MNGARPERPVLVTGATGFLGSRLAHGLVGRGERVRVLVRRTSDRRRIAALPVEIAEGDITDRRSVEAALDGVSAVYHSAALYEIGTPDPARMERVNVGGTAAVLETAAARGIPAVHVSSVVALGPTGREAADERHWSSGPPRSAYEATKRSAHQLARRLAAAGAPLRIALPVTIYGPDDPSLVGRFHLAYARGLVPVGAFADLVMSLVHVDDCAEGLVRIATWGAEGGETTRGGLWVRSRNGRAAGPPPAGRRPPLAFLPTSLLRRLGPVAALAAPIAGFDPALVREGLAMSDGVDWAFTSAKARRELGWAPRELGAGLEEVLAYYRRREA